MIEETLLLFIKAALENEEHLGDNLKKQCIDYVESLQQEKQQQKEAIDKAVDKLYCWGETLNPDFQKEMLKILKGVEDNGN